MGDGGHTERDVLVIGAGFAGLYALHRLRSLGFSVGVLEAGDGVGGTWYWNRYPGARCDSESYYYCYSFYPELEQEWRWTERYPRQPEILAYLEHVADRHDLRRDIEFGVRVAVGRCATATGWVLTDTEGVRRRCRWLVTAVGCLSAANVPDLPGLADFAGEWHHTGQWPHDGVDVTGKRVGRRRDRVHRHPGRPGPRGGGVAGEGGHLTVFQRTANYSVPARNAPLSEAEMAATKADYPEIRRVQRRRPTAHPFLVADVDALGAVRRRASRRLRGGLAAGRAALPGRRQGHARRPGRERVRPPTSSASKIHETVARPGRPPRPSPRATTTSRPSARRSTPATSRPTTGTTSRWST